VNCCAFGHKYSSFNTASGSCGRVRLYAMYHSCVCSLSTTVIAHGNSSGAHMYLSSGPVWSYRHAQVFARVRTKMHDKDKNVMCACVMPSV
jgi:hypothetical protein